MSGSKKKKRKAAKLAKRTQKAGAAVAARPEQATPTQTGAVFHQDRLLEPSRTKWQYGEWQALLDLDPAQIEADAERAKLILLVAAAHSHFGNHDQAKTCARQAITWGCDRSIVARVLISAATNSMARAAASLDDDSAESHFREAIRLVEPRADAKLLGRTRQIRETARLGLLPEAGALIDADLIVAQSSPEDHKPRLAILASEIELLRGEISESLKRGQLYRKDASGDDPAADLESRSVAQLGQDLWVLDRSNHKRNGFFIEFGATDGVALSNTLLLETEFGWAGLLAEPNPAFQTALKRNRHCTISDACIGARTGEDVEFILADVFGGIADYADSDPHAGTRKAYRDNGDSLWLTTISLEDFLIQHGAPREIDYLSVDTEGSEYDILAAFPFDRWTIRLITVEHNFTPTREKIHALLTGLGYQRTEAQWDDWYELTQGPETAAGR